MTVHFNSIKSMELSQVRDAAPHGSKAKTTYATYGKRVLDVCLVIAAAPLVVPVVAFLSVLILLQGQSPFYKQQRVGLGGRLFTMWKMQTMVNDADAKLQDHLARDEAARDEWTKAQKLKDDPRITRVGRILRKTSLDELPQLFNVLRGDMSLVGPRPMMISQRDMYPGSAYYNHRPGITGFWQVSDRNECEFSSRAKFDADYDEQVSLSTDVSLLIRTVGVVIRGTGY